ncbi:N-acetylglucosamine-6-phosphate deacetylase [Bifidobacterium mongoliense]|uniref:N-acetylglucosamine-6-phosphate deacetylase n=1 Tax=Bifidobacterium mongoliense DSM 21395 TaxID=1437603 RepID=A0A087C7J9_9BIFI|nr:N-acetylglucosamine-6-phosphate deacetylase [Bifidobacterium mongoliense DSM 21395]
MDGKVTKEERSAAVREAVMSAPKTFAIRNATKIDARGVERHFWLVSAHGAIVATGAGDDDFDRACTKVSLKPAASQGSADVSSAVSPTADAPVIDAHGAILTPGYIDIHSHGAWEQSFDDGFEGIAIARAGHAMHGTTRQVLSLITNPLDVMCANLRTVAKVCAERQDCIGAHLEGPFLALSRKGAHDPACLRDPEPQYVDRLLEASDGCIRQITIAPELPHGLEAIRRFSQAGVLPAIGHCDADYDTTKRGIDAGARILTHVFNAMNGIHHREPGPIPAVLEDSRVQVELINDGFHVQNPVAKLAFALFADRIALITDSMAATGCPDGAYTLGKLAVTVKQGHARLVSNGAIAGSTLTLEESVRRGVEELGLSAVSVVAGATLGPAHALGIDRPNTITNHPLGLLSEGYAADCLLHAGASWKVQSVWCEGRCIA